MYVGLLCNVNPTSPYPPCNAYHILTELSMWFKCIDPGRNRFGDLEQHGWTPVATQNTIISVRLRRTASYIFKDHSTFLPS